MEKNFWIGCALWGYQDWVGELFPSGSRSADFLQLYGQRFTAVEGNTTFYSIPDAKTVQRWATQTPAGFKFCPKVPKAITHNGLLVPSVKNALSFVEHMQGLGDRLGPLFLQLPPSYSPNNKADFKTFLTALPRSHTQFAVEVRHLDWFRSPHSEWLSEVLTDLGIGQVLLDSRPIYDVPDDPQLYVERKKPRVPVNFNASPTFKLVRYISHPNWQLNLNFLQDWAFHIQQWLQAGMQVYFFVHCPVEARSPANARAIQHFLEQQGLPIPPLPWDEIIPESTQLTLF